MQSTQRVDISAEGVASRSFAFDRVFDETSTQREIYSTVQDTALDVMKGYNGTIFAYGQTGSGKSHTIMGPNIHDPHLKGVMPNAIDHMFECIGADTSGAEISLGVSYLEVYREIIRDLLDPSKTNLQVRDSPLKGIYVEDLTTGQYGQFCFSPCTRRTIHSEAAIFPATDLEGMRSEFVTSKDDIMDLLTMGDKSRATASTNMNDTSSR
jgi:hypothetical protein